MEAFRTRTRNMGSQSYEYAAQPGSYTYVLSLPELKPLQYCNTAEI